MKVSLVPHLHWHRRSWVYRWSLVLVRRLADDFDRGHHSVILVFKDVAMKNKSSELFLGFERNENEHASIDVPVLWRHGKGVVPQIDSRIDRWAFDHQAVEQVRWILKQLVAVSGMP